MIQCLVSLGLLGLAGLLIDSHRRSWHRFQLSGSPDARLRRFARRQYRRRMMASSTIGVVGALLTIEPIVPRDRLWAPALYLTLLLLSCVTMLVLGLIDALASSHFYRRTQLEDRLKTTAALALELERAKAKAASESDDK